MTSALVERWVTGWCLSRQMSWRRDGESWLVEVAAETRSQERIAASPSLAEAHRLVEATTASDVWLTFIGEIHASVGAAVGSLDRVSGSECMMTARVEPGSVPAGVVIEHDGPVAHARIDIDGELAARGQVAVQADHAVFDRIETMPAFRRRGLGRQVMTGLAAWTADHHATTGVLTASVSGRKLYETLGWSTFGPVSTFRGRAE